MKQSIITLLLLLAIQPIFAQMDTLQLTFVGKEYNHIELQIEKTKINGISKNGKDWLFLYPDTLYSKQSGMRLTVEHNDSTRHIISFFGITKKDTVKVGDFGVPRNFKDTIYYYNTVVKFANDINRIDDIFILYNPPKELGAWWKWGALYYQDDYKKMVQEHIRLAKSEPNQHYFMTTFAKSTSRYKANEDIKAIYDSFSDSLKNTYYGLIVKENVDNKYKRDQFENRELMNSRTKQYEPIIINKSKPNYIIFSATWCGYCHQIVPELKKVYNDLKDKVEFTYISTDEVDDLDKWNEILKTKEIEWRSLSAHKNRKSVLHQYYISGIPHAILVMPDFSMKKIDIRKEDQKAELYKVAGK